MVYSIVRLWHLAPAGPHGWPLALLVGDDAEPVVAGYVTAPDVVAARDAADLWLTDRGETVLRWHTGHDGWIATTTPQAD